MNSHVVIDGRLNPDGSLELHGGIALPPGPVRVTVESAAGEARPAEPGATLAERFRNVIGCVSDLPNDMALNHDHYLYGTPKK
jgi:hypothetical protein